MQKGFPSPVLILTFAVSAWIVALFIGLQINAVVEEQQAVREMQVEVGSYDVVGSDVYVSFVFCNVSADISGHIEAWAYSLEIENRTIVNQTAVAVEIVDIKVDKETSLVDIPLKNMIPADEQYIIEMRLVTKTMVRRLPELYVFKEER
jgi:hypothetical protein